MIFLISLTLLVKQLFAAVIFVKTLLMFILPPSGRAGTVEFIQNTKKYQELNLKRSIISCMWNGAVTVMPGGILKARIKRCKKWVKQERLTSVQAMPLCSVGQQGFPKMETGV